MAKRFVVEDATDLYTEIMESAVDSGPFWDKLVALIDSMGYEAWRDYAVGRGTSDAERSFNVETYGEPAMRELESVLYRIEGINVLEGHGMKELDIETADQEIETV